MTDELSITPTSTPSVFRVASRTVPGRAYEVVTATVFTAKCQCQGFTAHRHCAHADAVVRANLGKRGTLTMATHEIAAIIRWLANNPVEFQALVYLANEESPE